MKLRLYNRAVSAIFVLLLFLPMVLFFVSRQQSVSSEEKRRLADIPELQLQRDAIKGFPRQFEQYFNDHFPGRTALTRLRSRIGLLFHASPSRAVVVGKDDWYFFNGDGAISEYMGRFLFSPLHLQRTVQLLQDRSEWLADRGSRYLFLPIPNKELIYQEFLPRPIRSRKGASKYEQVAEALYTAGFTDWLDTATLFFEHKNEGLLYLKTDSHWNTRGSLLTFNTLLKQVALPGFTPLATRHPLRWREHYSGDIAALMGLRRVVTERAPDMNFKAVCQPVTMRRMELPGLTKKLHQQRKPIEGGCSEASTKVVLIHDSFGSPLITYFNQVAGRAVYVNHFNFESLKLLIDSEKPDLVIDERVSRNLQRALLPDGELEQEMVQKHFAAGELLAKWEKEKETPPTFTLPRKKVLVKEVVTAQKPGGTELCFTAAGQQAECIKRGLKKGRNTIYTRLFLGGEGRFTVSGDNRPGIEAVVVRLPR